MSSFNRLFFFLAVNVFLLLTSVCPGQITVAVEDTVDLVPGYPKTVNLLLNDTIPSGDNVVVTGGISAGQSSVTSTWHYQGMFTYLAPNRQIGSFIIGNYTLNNLSTGQSSTARILFRILDYSYDTLNINDVEAVFTVSGLHFVMIFNPGEPNACFIPKGSGKSTLFINSFWIGGLDELDTLHIAAERYRQTTTGYIGLSPDFYAGPVMDTANYSALQDSIWNTVWTLKRTEIEYHKLHWQDAGYIPIKAIATWPGNGNTALGQSAILAPFHDNDLDGIYEPADGDYPSIRGDQAIFFIFNDERGKHKESGGNKLRIEVHGMAYAFDLPGDSAFSKTIFLNYKIFNRSAHTYHDTRIGMYTDFDIGYFRDDNFQTDVERGSVIAYNGKAIDGSGESYAYGPHPPAQSVTLLAGPWMPPTGQDRPRFDSTGHPLCNESINGTGFGDGIADNERWGLVGSACMVNQWPSWGFPYMRVPVTATEYGNYLKGKWKDGSPMMYGGNGHSTTGGYGPETSFHFPGESDTLHWGCGCRPPNGPAVWSEQTAGNTPHDVTSLITSGPVTFHPGDMQEFDVAFVWARDYTNPDTLVSVAKLRSMIDTVRKAFLTNRLPGGGSFLGTPNQPAPVHAFFTIYPNPAAGQVTVDFEEPLKEPAQIRIYSASGMRVRSLTGRTGNTK
ncbi:MAG TPA: hypothetical protein PLK82_02750, partial [Bacteroidales bacterium]|nr:hypothetical protein [Bacteroidales bacterium]